MNNIYDILEKFNSVAGKQTLTEGAKPDFLDLDKDGNKTEPMKQAAADKKAASDKKFFDKIGKSAGKMRDIEDLKLAKGEYKEEIDEVSYSAKAARAGRDIGKPGKQFAKIAKSAGERYGSKERGEKVAGAVLAKLRKGAKEGVEEADMEEGNEFTDARLAAIKAGKPTFQVGGKSYKVTGDTSDERKQVDELDVNLIKAAQKHSKEHPRKVDPESERNIHKKYGYRTDRDDTGNDDDYDEWGNEKKSAKKAKSKDEGPKKKGRPKGTGRSLGAKGPTGRSKLLSKGAIKEAAPQRALVNAVVSRMQSWVDYRDYGTLYDVDESDIEPALTSNPKDPKGKEIWQHLQKMPVSDYNRFVQAVMVAIEKKADDDDEMYEDMPPGATPDDAGEYGNEGDMAKDQIHTIVRNARDLEKILRNNEDLPEWVQSKLAKIEGMMTAVSDYMQSQHERGDEMSDEEGVSVAEKAPPGAKAERMVKHIKKAYAKDGKLTPKEKSIAYATAWKAKKAGKVEEEGKEEMEETTAGSVATAPAAETPKAKGKKGSIQFGKGVYESRLEESYRSRLETMLTEGISINASQGEDGKKTLTVNATDEDAVKLAQILQLAGMPQGHDYHDACPGCGQSPCGCDEVEESLANSPDPVYANTEMINSQGEDLHKPKSTGQTTVPVLNKDAARQGVSHEMAKIQEEAEGRLWKLYQKYEGQS